MGLCVCILASHLTSLMISSQRGCWTTSDYLSESELQAELDSPDHICMTMLDISTVSLDLKGARLLQWELEVDVLSHLHLLIKQRCLTLLGQAAACILQTANDPRRALQNSLHASGWLPSLMCLPNASKPQLAVRHVERNKHTAKLRFLCKAPCSVQCTTCT